MPTPIDKRPLRPDFIIVGAAKAGTTSLFAHVSRHPQVFASPIKEPSFFSYWPDRPVISGIREVVERYRKLGGQVDEASVAAAPPADAWRWFLPAYESLFEGAAPNQMRGEASTNYTRHPQYPGVPERMASVAPDAKLIYIMRHPVDRAYSHFVHRYSKETNRDQPFRTSFEQYIEREPVCIDSSRYMMQIDKLLNYYRRDSILFLFLDDLNRDPVGSAQRVFSFLGIDATFDVTAAGSGEKHNVDRVFRETVVKKALTRPFRAWKPLYAVWRVLPREFRERVVGTLARSIYGRRIRKRFTPPPMSEVTRRALGRELQDETRRLGEFLGRDLSAWMSDR